MTAAPERAGLAGARERSGEAAGLVDVQAGLVDVQAGLGEAQPGFAEAQARLAEAQARVVAALVAGAEVPEGFDPERMRVQARSLIAKRRAIVARIRPDTATAAGSDLAAEFTAYAKARATPPPGYRADADDFAAWLRERGRMPATEPPPRRRWWSRLLPQG
ncbi:hypothetical protein AB0I81_16850 [Nonomuraea sp. NPDC050404]|uniref:hypothetical protein n=1 Tax=Nonomuraea sp. NPDC050404 TaxID=3155783 RepID=UPI0033EE154C